MDIIQIPQTTTLLFSRVTWLLLPLHTHFCVQTCDVVIIMLHECLIFMAMESNIIISFKFWKEVVRLLQTLCISKVSQFVLLCKKNRFTLWQHLLLWAIVLWNEAHRNQKSADWWTFDQSVMGAYQFCQSWYGQAMQGSLNFKCSTKMASNAKI